MRGVILFALLLAGICAVPAQAVLIDVELAELPVTDAFSLVARQAKLDLQIEPDLEAAGQRPDKLPWGPPNLQLKLKQVAADQVLESMAGAYGLVLDQSKGRNYVKLRFAGGDELVFKREARSLPDPVKNHQKVPLLFFDEAPVMVVVETLARQCGLNLMTSLELTLGKNPQGVAWQDVFISLKIRNVTSQQALEAVLDASGLVVDWSALGQIGVIYPVGRFAKPAGAKSQAPPPVKEEKTDFVLADLELEDFIKLIAGQLEVNWMVSTAVREAVTGADKQPLMQSAISISQKGITPLSALQDVLKSKGLEFRWNPRAEVGVVDLVPAK
jgi:hypothetical protein